ncbi:MAG: hypothetical protein ACOCXG_01640 [Nanoarchaeota archaeon]
MEFKDYIGVYENRIKKIKDMFEKKKVKLCFDTLNKKPKTDHEQIFCNCGGKKEDLNFYIFGFDFYLKELKEQEFKRILGTNPLNLKIYHAYNQLKKKQKKVKVTEILNYMQDENKDSLEVHKILRRILTLSYYFDWTLTKDKKDIEGDSYIEIPPFYLVKLKQRYDFDPVAYVYENEELFVFVNKRGKLNIILKNKNEFDRPDIETFVAPVMQKVFNIKEVLIENK